MNDSKHAPKDASMSKRIRAALSITVILCLIGYVLFWVLFEQKEVTTTKDVPLRNPAPQQKKKVLPRPAVKQVSIVSVEGEVQRQSGDSRWVPVKKGDKLQMDETIKSYKNGRAVMDIGTTAVVEITPNSEFTVKDISKSVSRVQLGEGHMSAVVSGEGDSKLKVEVRGSDAAAVAKTGKFSMLSDGKGHVSLATQKGRVRLSAKNKSVEVVAGMQATVKPDLPPLAPEPIPQSLFLRVARPQSLILRKKDTVIRGTTEPGAVISINSISVPVDEKGNFREKIPLNEGKNLITVVARDVVGRTKETALPSIILDTRPPQAKSTIQWGQ